MRVAGNDELRVAGDLQRRPQTRSNSARVSRSIPAAAIPCSLTRAACPRRGRSFVQHTIDVPAGPESATHAGHIHRADRRRVAREPAALLHSVLRADVARDCAWLRASRRRGGDGSEGGVPAARRRSLERRPHAIHGVLRSRPREVAASGRTSSSAARFTPAGSTPSWLTPPGPMRTAGRSRRSSGMRSRPPPQKNGRQPADWKIATPPASARRTHSSSHSPGASIAACFSARSACQPAAGTASRRHDCNRRRRTVWRFTPSAPWRPGEHELVVLSILEDPAGNRVGRAFEIEMFQKPLANPVERVTVPFMIARR